MSTHNDVTGNLITSRPNSDAYADGWERIFGKKETNSSEENWELIIEQEEINND